MKEDEKLEEGLEVRCGGVGWVWKNYEKRVWDMLGVREVFLGRWW